jgi:hypothetical protein
MPKFADNKRKQLTGGADLFGPRPKFVFQALEEIKKTLDRFFPADIRLFCFSHQAQNGKRQTSVSTLLSPGRGDERYHR